MRMMGARTLYPSKTSRNSLPSRQAGEEARATMRSTSEKTMKTAMMRRMVMMGMQRPALGSMPLQATAEWRRKRPQLSCLKAYQIGLVWATHTTPTQEGPLQTLSSARGRQAISD